MDFDHKSLGAGILAGSALTALLLRLAGSKSRDQRADVAATHAVGGSAGAGAAAADASVKPHLYYFGLRGRGEPVRLALAAAGVDWDESLPDRAVMKTVGADYAFGQAPAFEHNGLRLCQMDAILRYCGRTWGGLYPADARDAATVDMIMLGVEDMRRAYTTLAYTGKFAREAKASYVDNHMEPDATKGRTGGAHFYYLEHLLERDTTGMAEAGRVVGGRMSIADIQLFDIVDLHLRDAAFPAEMRDRFPKLVAHHDSVAKLPRIRAYLDSARRQAKVNGNGMG